MKHIKRFIWKLKATFWYFWLMQCWNVKFCWGLAGASLENIGYDTTEDVRDCVEEELSCWGQ